MDIDTPLSDCGARPIQPLRSEGGQPMTQKTLGLGTPDDARLFRLMYDLAPVGIAHADAEGRCLRANPRFRELTGYSIDELHAIGLDTIICADDLAAEAARRARLLAGEIASYECERRYVRKDGRLVSVRATTFRVPGEPGAADSFVSLVQDDTERRRAESALRESEERFRAVFEQSPIASTISDPNDYTYVDVNEAFRKEIGLTREQIVGRDAAEIGLGFPVETVREFLGRLVADGIVNGFEVEFAAPDFSPVVMSLYARFIEIQGKRLVLTSALEMSAQKRVERALRESEARFRAAFDTSPAVISVSALDTGMIVDVNKTFCEALRRPREEVVGRTSKELGIWKQWNLREDLVQRIREGAEIDGVEAGVFKGDGTEATYNLSLRRILLEGEAHMLLYGVDVTERKRFEAQRADFERQLTQIQRIEAIGTLAGGIAHDFNNILGAIIGCTEMAQMSYAADPTAHDDLDKVLEAAHRATALVKQILVFARQTKQEVASVAIKPIAAEALKLLRATLPANVLIAEELGTDATVLADPSQLHQIVMNLCTNAGLAMRDGGGTLRLALDEVELDAHEAERVGVLPGRFVRLTVADTGCGMPPEVLGRIFEPFFTTRPIGQGTGLGLSVAHGIIRGRGGAISVRSEVGRGTEFRVSLPIDDGKTPSDEPKRVPASPGTERVLFVDDEVLLVEVTSRALEALGYRVTGLTDSALALATFRAAPYDFDIAVTDAMMPGLGGEQLVREFKKIRPDLPVVVATGYSERITRESARARGFDGYLQKPVTAADVTTLVRKLFDSGRFCAGATAGPLP
jgi:PAS domain S-box-containing protein